MTIETKAGAAGVELHIFGIIKSMDDSLAIKQAVLEQLARDKTARITLIIEDSFIMTSSVIGSLLKMIQKDRVDLSVMVKSGELLELLQKLNLIGLLNVTKI